MRKEHPYVNETMDEIERYVLCSQILESIEGLKHNTVGWCDEPQSPPFSAQCTWSSRNLSFDEVAQDTNLVEANKHNSEAGYQDSFLQAAHEWFSHAKSSFPMKILPIPWMIIMYRIVRARIGVLADGKDRSHSAW